MKTMPWRSSSPMKIARAIRELSAEHSDRTVFVSLRNGWVELRMEFPSHHYDDIVCSYDSSSSDDTIIHDITEAAFSEISMRRKAA